MSSKSTRSRRSRKGPADRPKKPYPAFPLSPHASGAWQKKIRGKVHYFGHWARRVDGKLTRVEGDGWKEALELYNAQADDLLVGRTPRAKSGEPTLGYLCNLFLTAKLRRLGLPDKDIKELADLPTSEWLPVLVARAGVGHRISPRMCQEYKAAVDRLVEKFGKNRLIDDLRPEDFAALGNDLAKQYGPVRRGNEIQKVRTIFKFAFDNDLIQTPIRFGSEFKKPDTTELRKHRAENGEKMLEAAELRKLIEAAPVPVKAMLLLGVNGGFGNHDVATLPLSALDLDRGWINYPRPKTGIPRRSPLWPETVEALRAAIAERPELQQDEAAGLVFLTTRGRAWLTRGIANGVSVAVRDLMKTVGIHHRGLGFYTLRHVFRTVADAARDPVAIDLIMGHSDPSMASHYRERVEDSRLQAVSEHVRHWLFGKAPDDGTARDTTTPEDEPPAPKARGKEGWPTLRLYREGGAA